MRRGDVYMVDLEPTHGREQRGHRPVVVVSPDEFNQATGLPVVMPITNGGEFARRIGFAVLLAGTNTTGVVRCDQPRVLDLKVRNGRRVESLPQEIMDEVLAKAATIFEQERELLPLIFGIVVFGTSCVGFNKVAKRKFERTNEAGVEQFSSYGAKERALAFERLIYGHSRHRRLCDGRLRHPPAFSDDKEMPWLTKSES